MADETRSRLGRGLASLIGDMGGEPTATERGRSQRRVPIAFLRPNPFNPRKDFPAGQLDELAQSIKARGMIQPIVGCFTIASRPGDAGHTEYCHDCHKFLHAFHLFSTYARRRLHSAESRRAR